MVVVVDDEPEIVDIIVETLAHSGLRCEGFTNPLDSLKFIKQNINQIDLVIIDYSMVPMNGLELIKSLRVLGLDCHYVIHTGIDDAENTINIMDFESQMLVKHKTIFMLKPFHDLASNILSILKS